MTKIEEKISRLTETQTTIMSTEQSTQEDIRALTLQLTALEGKVEESISNRNSDQVKLLLVQVSITLALLLSKNLKIITQKLKGSDRSCSLKHYPGDWIGKSSRRKITGQKFLYGIIDSQVQLYLITI